MSPDTVSQVPPPMARAPADAVRLKRAAQAFEARFLSEMLKAAKLGEDHSDFGGGAGEAQFASFVRDAHAEALAARGGIGLAEHIFNALKDRVHD